MKKNLLITISSIMLFSFPLIGCNKSYDVELELYSPSVGGGQYIAPSRSFKVICKITKGSVPDDAVARVSLLDKDGKEIRYTETNKKGIDMVDLSWPKYQYIDRYKDGRNINDYLDTVPELVVTDKYNPKKTCYDATSKCIYTDNLISAHITAATDKAHGLPIDDYFYFVNHDGTPISAFPAGDYKILVTLHSKKGELLGKANRDIHITNSLNPLIMKFTDDESFEYISNWAKENNYKLLSDPLPGSFGLDYSFSYLEFGYESEFAEYLFANPGIINYKIDAESISYLEIGNAIQKFHLLEEGNVPIYCYSLGEHRIGGKISTLMRMNKYNKIHLYRLDEVNNDAKEGCYNTLGKNVISTNTEIDDGLVMKFGSRFAITGVTMPYQIEDQYIIETKTDPKIVIALNNGVDKIKYTFTHSDGEIIVEERNIGLARSETSEYKRPSIYEFYNIFEPNVFTKKGEYSVLIEGYDRYNKPIDNMTKFTKLTLI